MIFRSPVSQKLKVSYSDHSLSVVRCLSLSFSCRHHLLLNNRTNFNQTSQECSFGGPLPSILNRIYDKVKLLIAINFSLMFSRAPDHNRLFYSIKDIFIFVSGFRHILYGNLILSPSLKTAYAYAP